MAFEDNDEYLEQVKKENNLLRERNNDLSTGVTGSQFLNQRSPDNIRYQLDTTELLQNLERFYRGDKIEIDAEGNEVYKSQDNKELILFNEYGIGLLMTAITPYIIKHTFLSYYSEERINEILADIGDALTDLVQENYDKMGMDTQYKKSRYPLIVLSSIHIIESAYRRAIGGKEREEINSSRIYMPNNTGLGMGNNPVTKRKFNLFNIKTW